jgi:Flp pilus assembly protein TadD
MISKGLRLAVQAAVVATLVGGPLFAAGTRSDKPSTPSPAIPERTATPEEKAAAAKARSRELYDQGYEEVDKAAATVEEIAKLEAASDKKSTEQAAKLRETRAKHYRKAIEKFQKATELDASYHEAWNMLGYSYRKAGQIGNAFKAYAACLELAPDFEQAHEYLGEAHLIAGDLEKANAELAWLKGRKSQLAGQLEEAIGRHVKGQTTGSAAGSGW